MILHKNIQTLSEFKYWWKSSEGKQPGESMGEGNGADSFSASTTRIQVVSKYPVSSTCHEPLGQFTFSQRKGRCD
jgi:hypothetical protein